MGPNLYVATRKWALFGQGDYAFMLYVAKRQWGRPLKGPLSHLDYLLLERYFGWVISI
jgi:hypothetical protein